MASPFSFSMPTIDILTALVLALGVVWCFRAGLKDGHNQ